jgi:hypothetical protein
VSHGGHTDYLRDGHLHHPHGDHVDEHVIAVSSEHPDSYTSDDRCGGHDAGHVHAPGCGHEAVPHGKQVDWVA